MSFAVTRLASRENEADARCDRNPAKPFGSRECGNLIQQRKRLELAIDQPHISFDVNRALRKRGVDSRRPGQVCQSVAAANRREERRDRHILELRFEIGRFSEVHFSSHRDVAGAGAQRALVDK